ncbi:hypothetical protein Tco_0773236 [Tanacetum coccineum]|uniref:Reverse transcriptase domain-containing protein n=1 Tax=Tanacetum coccineum TaxID=301880 RepID=A0ABQ4ZKA3_9ASTR
MHTRASISELVKPLPEPECTLNRRLRRRNRRVPYDQRNNPPQHPRIIYPSILNINYFRNFLDIFRNYDPIDDEPMWATNYVVTPTLSSAITIPKIANEFAIKEVLNAATGGIFLYKTPNQAYQLLEDKVSLKLDWAKNQKTKSSLKKTVAFADEGNSNTDTDKIMARMDAITIKMDAQYKELQSRAKQPTPDLDDDDIPMSREEEVAKNHQASIQNLENKFDRLADKQSDRPSGSLPSNTQPNPRGSKAYQPPQARNEHVNVVFTRSGKSYNLPDNPDDQQNNSENPINFDSDDEDDEPTP